jgi:hypothetical protein
MRAGRGRERTGERRRRTGEGGRDEGEKERVNRRNNNLLYTRNENLPALSPSLTIVAISLIELPHA